ncbi:MAG TPA: Calx-beta domain-containing protein [Acidimicrobiales bacterium]|nr:Calx-beta domain-containing protein [Acidimicrobiales bacterium]
MTIQPTDTLGVPLAVPLLSRSTVRFRTADGSATAPSDYQQVDVVVEFRGTETTKTVTVPLAGDGRYEHHETVSLLLSEPAGAKLGPQSTATLTILNDDAPPVASVAGPEPVVEGSPVRFTVSLADPSDLPATVSYATADGSATAWADYQPTSGSVTIPAGSTSAEIVVSTVGDQTTEDLPAHPVQPGPRHPGQRPGGGR